MKKHVRCFKVWKADRYSFIHEWGTREKKNPDWTTETGASP